MNHSIDILLSTYNGALYLREQLDSLLEQSFTDWHLILRDDGSTDETLVIASEYANRHPGKFTILQTDGNLGYYWSFMELLAFSSAPYVMFCDQDDVWMSNKISISFSVIEHCESLWPGKPILVHTDMTVVDNKLGLISDSKWKDMKWTPDAYVRDSKSLMVVPLVSGNTCLFNSIAREVSLAKKEEIHSHDTWVALSTMVAQGRIINLPFSTILYRRHQKVASASTRRINGSYVLRVLMKPGRIVEVWKREIGAARKAGVSVSWPDFLLRKGRYLLDKYLFF
jgi:glycosyltransferase involved in cell wall biosynthesis